MIQEIAQTAADTSHPWNYLPGIFEACVSIILITSTTTLTALGGLWVWSTGRKIKKKTNYY